MEICYNCKKELACIKQGNGCWYCKKCNEGYEFYGVINLLLQRNQEKMAKEGIKRGSIGWMRGNFRVLKEHFGGLSGMIINWKEELRMGGIIGVIKIFLAKLTA